MPQYLRIPQLQTTPGPVQFNLDGASTAVSRDTATPANSRPLPVSIIEDATGTPADLATETTLDLVRVASEAAATSVAGINGKTTKANTDDVKVTSSVLPTGAATAANQSTANTSLSSIDGKTPALVAGRVPVDGSGVTQPISAASLPLPTGAATAANQATANTSLASIAAKDFATQTTLAALASSAATEATLAALKALFPTSIGQKASAASLAVVLASDQPTLNVSTGTPAAKTVKQAAITVGTAAVRATTDGLAPTAGRVRLSIRPDSGNTGAIYYGSSSVTSSGGTRGLPIFNGESIDMTNDAGDYYLISDTASQTVFIVEQE